MSTFTPAFKATIGLIVFLVVLFGLVLNQISLQKEITILEQTKPVVIKEVVPSATPSASLAPSKVLLKTSPVPFKTSSQSSR